MVDNYDSFEPVEDTLSVPSADDETASQRTMQRTQEARTGEYEIMQVMLANEELAAVVTDVLANFGREKFVRNFRRQLKRYYLRLEHSATLEPQKLAISLLRRRVARLWIATTLADRLGLEEENAFDWERLDVEHIDTRKRLNEWLHERYESTNFSTLVSPVLGPLTSDEKQILLLSRLLRVRLDLWNQLSGSQWGTEPMGHEQQDATFKYDFADTGNGKGLPYFEPSEMRMDSKKMPKA